MRTRGRAGAHANRFVSTVAWALLVVSIVIGLVTLRLRPGHPAGQDKADEFIAALDDAGLTAPPTRTRSPACSATTAARLRRPRTSALRQAITYTQLANGAAGPGMRPIIADRPVSCRASCSIIQIYCPDELEDFQEFVDDLKSDDVTER